MHRAAAVKYTASCVRGLRGGVVKARWTRKGRDCMRGLSVAVCAGTCCATGAGASPSACPCQRRAGCARARAFIGVRNVARVRTGTAQYPKGLAACCPGWSLPGATPMLQALASGRTLPPSVVGSSTELQRQVSAYGGLRWAGRQPGAMQSWAGSAGGAVRQRGIKSKGSWTSLNGNPQVIVSREERCTDPAAWKRESQGAP